MCIWKNIACIGVSTVWRLRDKLGSWQSLHPQWEGIHFSSSRGDREFSEHLTPEESRDPPVGVNVELASFPRWAGALESCSFCTSLCHWGIRQGTWETLCDRAIARRTKAQSPATGRIPLHSPLPGRHRSCFICGSWVLSHTVGTIELEQLMSLTLRGTLTMEQQTSIKSRTKTASLGSGRVTAAKAESEQGALGRRE